MTETPSSSQSLGAPSSNWSCSAEINANGTAVASLQLSVNSGTPLSFTIKAVCYSPCPINGSNGSAPNLGDWFWDSYSGPGYNISGWNGLWERDLPNLAKMGANTIRVYNMMSRQLNTDGTYPQPWNSGQLFTHDNFLNACQAQGLYVIVGIALPQQLFWTDPPGPAPTQGELDFWNNVLNETAVQVGSHPAVLGFVFMNEWDSTLVTYPQPPSEPTNLAAVQYWWSQIEQLASVIKTAAPGKLAGIAVHDDPNICGLASAYMAQCPSINFWGVNTYQTQSLQPVFGSIPNIGPGYGGLTGTALKPVILTEWGMPATTRTDPNKPATICQTTTSIANAASVVTDMVPQAYAEPVCVGLCYFEYSDEWWNQGGSPNIYTWWGGTAAPGFPNGYWDQDGFGLYHTIPGAGANGGSIWSQNGGTGEPALPLDTMDIRQATVSAVQTAFNAA